jgi:hypothetical protein
MNAIPLIDDDELPWVNSIEQPHQMCHHRLCYSKLELMQQIYNQDWEKIKTQR